MKRKTIGAAAAYMSGSFFASFLFGVNGLLIIAAAVILLYLLRRRLGIDRYDVILMTGFFAAAVAAHLCYEHFIVMPQKAFGGKEGSYIGEITEVDHYAGDTASYILKGTVYSDGMNPVPAKISYYGDDTGAQTGDTLSIGKCVFTIPEDTYLYDSETYYRAQGIYLTAEKASDVSTSPAEGFDLIRCISSYRERMIADYRIALGEEAGGMLAGIVFGEKSALDRSAKTVLYRTGIGHLLAVSGLHVSILAGLVLLLCRKLRAGRIVSFIVMNIAMVLLILLANSPVSAIRAALMLDMVGLARLVCRRSDPLNGLAIASLLINIMDPCAIYSAGFMLSLSGTFGIAVIAPFMLNGLTADAPLRKAGKAFLTGLFTTLAVFPVSVLYFDEISIISPLTNIAAVPVCAAAMVIGLLYAVTGGLIDLLGIAGFLLEGIITASEHLARLPGVYINCTGAAVPAVLIGSGAAAVVLYLFFRSRRITATVVSAGILLSSVVSGVYGYMRWNTLTAAVLGDNGKAAVVLSYHGRADVIDLSGSYSDAKYVRKYLSASGISSVETIILTDKVQSQYSAYSDQMSLVKLYSWIIAGQTPVSGDDGILYGEGAVDISTECYDISLSEGTLTITRPGGEILLTVRRYDSESLPADTGAEITYGKNGIAYLSAMPDVSNFEIVYPDGNNHYIRRL